MATADEAEAGLTRKQKRSIMQRRRLNDDIRKWLRTRNGVGDPEFDAKATETLAKLDASEAAFLEAVKRGEHG